jgi:flagellar biogenesis protein FliO
MQRDCYRCKQTIEEHVAFCSACGAPQIRVTMPEQPSEEPALPQVELTSDQIAMVSGVPANLVGRSGIQWKSFIRTAAPMAAFTGMLTVILPPLGLFILLPVSLIATIYIYRRTRPAPMRSGQGARMGALMGLLSFIFFAAFFLVAVSLNEPRYREVIVDKIQEVTAQNPDQQVQQALQWFATTDGLIALTVMILATILVFFLIIGMSSGALAVALSKARNRPQL